jgi:two-component system, cell cycle sensor histidine kinase and response regulator CckA
MLVVFVGFAASFGTYFAAKFPFVTLLIGLVATLIAAGVLGLAAGRRDEALVLVEAELQAKNSQVDEVLSRQAEAEQSLLQAHRMEAVGQLAGGIAHDFNNLLQAILSYSEFLSDGLDPDSEMQQDVAEVQKAAHRAAGLTRQLLIFSRQDVTAPAVIDLHTSVRNAQRLLRYTVGEDIELSFQMGNVECLVLADSGELEMLLLNLAINARDAMPYGGTLEVSVDTIELDVSSASSQGLQPGTYARMEVKDNGEGMTSEVAARAFEPFLTTKETGRGAGLGLAMVYGIANRSGGTASLTTADGVGTTVTVLIPRSVPPGDSVPGSPIQRGTQPDRYPVPH